MKKQAIIATRIMAGNATTWGKPYFVRPILITGYDSLGREGNQ
jgi:hypothetical protein